MGALKRYADPEIADRLDEVMRAYASDSKWGELLGVYRKTVWAWRNGVTTMPSDRLRDVCRIAKVSADYILFGRISDD